MYLPELQAQRGEQDVGEDEMRDDREVVEGGGSEWHPEGGEHEATHARKQPHE